MSLRIPIVLCLVLSCYVIDVMSEVRGNQLLARFALAREAKSLLNDSSTLFQSIVKENLGDALTLEEIPRKSSQQIRDDLNSGSIDIAVLSSSIFPGSISGYVTGSDIEGSRRRQESEVGAYELARLEKDGLVGLAFWNVEPRHIVVQGQIKNLAELKGKKISTFESSSHEILKELGATPVKLRSAEVYNALQMGVVDAAELRVGSEIFKSAIKSDFRTYLAGVTGNSDYMVVVRKEFWTSLPYRLQIELAKATRKAAKKSDQVASLNIDRSLKYFDSQGISVVRFDKPDPDLRRAVNSAWVRNDQNLEILSRAISVTNTIPEPSYGIAHKFDQVQVVYFATVRALENETAIEYQFGNRRRDEGLNYGFAAVSLNAGRRLGDDLAGITTIDNFEHLSSENHFVSKIKSNIDVVKNQEVLVFVHGYNTSFLDALRRAAQFSVDSGFNGPVIVFSWPSDGSTILYFHDEDRISATRFGFTNLLTTLEKILPRNKINILAHSMGTRIVLDYTGTLKQTWNGAAKGKYRSITFAASDAPIEYLRVQKDFLPEIAELVTIYFSEKDRALWLSNKLHQNPRLGSISTTNIFVEPQSTSLSNSDFDFVSAAEIDKDFFTFSPRHSYVFEKERGIKDIGTLIHKGIKAKDRHTQNPAALTSKENGGKIFWELKP